MLGDHPIEVVLRTTDLQASKDFYVGDRLSRCGGRADGELKRSIEGISQKMLTQTQRSMEGDGLVQRNVVNQIPPHVEYSLTPLGQSLSGPLVAIYQWAMAHLAEMQAARNSR